MALRHHGYAESLGSSSSTSSTFADKVALVFTPQANQTYWIIGNARIGNSGTSVDTKVRLFSDTFTETLREYNVEFKDGTDRLTCFFLDKYVAGSSPSEETRSIEFASETTASVNIDNATLLMLKAHQLDQYAENETEASTASSTLQDYTTLTFTPPTTGDYLILASAEFKTLLNGADVAKLVLDVGGTKYGEAERTARDATNYYSWFTAVRLNLTNTSKTIKIQFSARFGGNATVRRGAILAIRLDGFANNYYAEARTRTEAEDSFVTKVTLTHTPQAREHLIFACGVLDGNDSDEYSTCLIDKATVNQTQMIVEASGNGADYDEVCFSHMRRDTLTNTSITWRTRFEAEDIFNDAGFQQSAIAIIDLEDVITSVSGNSHTTNGDSTSTASGKVVEKGTLVKTNQGDIGSATNIPNPSGTLARTNQNDSPNISGNVTPGIRYIASAIPSGTPTSSFTITVPAVEIGDLLVLDVCALSNDADIVVVDNDSGGETWILKHSRAFGPNLNSDAELWYKRATSATGAKVITVSSTGANAMAGTLTVYRAGVSFGDPFDVVQSEANTMGNETQASVTVTLPNTMLCLANHLYNSASNVSLQTCSDPGTFSERAEKQTNSSLGTDATTAHSSRLKETSGSTGTITWSHTNVESASIVYAIKAPIANAGTFDRTNADDSADFDGIVKTVTRGTVVQNEADDISSVAAKLRGVATLSRTLNADRPSRAL